MVLDSHTHAWGPPSRDHPWVNGPLVEHSVDAFSVETVYRDRHLVRDMDAAGIDRAVVVGYPTCDWRDNSYTVEVAEANDRLAAIVMIDPFADDAVEQLEAYMAVEGVLGFRLGAICPYDRMWETFDPSQTWLRDAITETEFWGAVGETDAVVQLLAHETQLDQAIELVEAYPDYTYLFDHFAHADPAVAPSEGPLAAVERLADYPGVAVKVSEIVHRSAEPHPYTDMHEHVRWYLDTFGRERVIWGSDFPNVSDEATYIESLTWLEHVDGLSEADKEWITERAFDGHVGFG